MRELFLLPYSDIVTSGFYSYTVVLNAQAKITTELYSPHLLLSSLVTQLSIFLIQEIDDSNRAG